MPFDASELARMGRSFQIAGERIGAGVALELNAGGRRMYADARGRVAVASGEARDSITLTITGDGRFGSMEVKVEALADHSLHLEQGTSDTAPQPFLAPTFDAVVPTIEAKLAKVGVEAIG